MGPGQGPTSQKQRQLRTQQPGDSGAPVDGEDSRIIGIAMPRIVSVPEHRRTAARARLRRKNVVDLIRQVSNFGSGDA